MTLIHGFQSTTVWKAFALNSIVASLIIIVAIYIKSYFDIFSDINTKKVTNEDGEKVYIIKRVSPIKGAVITMITTFSTAFITYTIMYFVFGFGRGMMVNKENHTF